MQPLKSGRHCEPTGRAIFRRENSLEFIDPQAYVLCRGRRELRTRSLWLIDAPIHFLFLSWPGRSRLKDGVASARLSRPSTSFLFECRQDVDARDKPAHDELDERTVGHNNAGATHFSPMTKRRVTPANPPDGGPLLYAKNFCFHHQHPERMSDRAASLARVKFVMSVICPFGRCTRHILAHFASGLMVATARGNSST
jgi:hypothetical protein